MTWSVVSGDGTWNTPERPSVTDVRRLHCLLGGTDTRGNRRVAFYASEVGTTGSLEDRVRAGTLGSDLDAKILDGYRWLVTRYSPGDRIALFANDARTSHEDNSRARLRVRKTR
jgi:uncharacterized protein (DUF2235 family)